MNYPHGTVGAGFAPVRDEFSEILARTRGGAAFSVVRRGETLVDLWGGMADRRAGAPWHEDTVVVLFSGTKGIAATVMAGLVDEGVIDVRERVSSYWPEFGAGGKGDARVHHVLSHTVGLPYVDPAPQGEFAVLDNAANAAILALQAPLWTPGEKVAYHAMTYGYLLTEIVRRTTGRRVGQLVADRITQYHGLDLHLGTSPALDRRVARLMRHPDYRISTFLRDDPERRAVIDRMYSTLLDSDELINSDRYRRAENAAGGAVGSARSMATMYDLLLRGELVSRRTLADATETWSGGLDVINDRPVRFGLGYELADPIGTYGPVDVAFGHSGAGGGRHGAWPQAELGFSFTTNEMCSEDTDRRASGLLATLADLI